MPKESLKQINATLVAQDTREYRALNQRLFFKNNKACIIIDDDPTGNQTVYDVPLLSNWNLSVFIKEFIEGTPVFFVLTNSRSLGTVDTAAIYKAIASNILKAAEITKRDFTVISRSDSTLRGHFPLEPDTLRQGLKLNEAITVFIPVMFEGHRVTVNDTHYIAHGDVLTPVNETPFAEDHSFRYTTANLKAYIEEKSQGRIAAKEVFSFSLEQIRTLEVGILAEIILEIPAAAYCIFNSLNYADLDKVCHALLIAEHLGKQILYRTSSSFVPSYIGLPPRPLLEADRIIEYRGNGGLTIVGSYVKKTSEQLVHALELFSSDATIVVDAEKVLSQDYKAYIEELTTRIDTNIQNGMSCIVYTSRKLVTGANPEETIAIAHKISTALVDIVKHIKVRPSYIIAKGGITSHDLAEKGLNMQRAKVAGQILPGIPLWKLCSETRFPTLPYIVFPGNVGDKHTLKTIITKLNHNAK